MFQGGTAGSSLVDVRPRFEFGHEAEDLLVSDAGFMKVDDHFSLKRLNVGRIHSKALGDEVSNDGGYGSTIGAHLGG